MGAPGKPHTQPAREPAGHPSGPGPRGTARRKFLKVSAGVMAGTAAAQVLPGAVQAQRPGADDTELRRLEPARRILLKDGLVLTLAP